MTAAHSSVDPTPGLRAALQGKGIWKQLEPFAGAKRVQADTMRGASSRINHSAHDI